MKLSDPKEIKLSFQNFSNRDSADYLKIYENLKNIDFSRVSEFDHELINLLFSKCILAIRDYSETIFDGGDFELMRYSMFRHYVNKISLVVLPLFQIRIAPKILRHEIFIEIKYQDRVKHYRFIYGKGFIEIKPEEFFDKMNKIDSNDGDTLEFIPLTEMEF